MKPDGAYAYNNRGYSKFKLQHYDAALEDINRSLELNAYNAYAYRNRALVYLELGKTRKACKDMEKALEYDYTRMYGSDVEELHEEHCD
jgi:tetratricopeptide (TPR) repeat protein